VHNLISQQESIKVAFLAFEERFRAVPGDYVQASATIAGVTQNGNGNGRVETGAVPNEAILAWEHLSRAGFVTRTYTYNATESATTTPTNPYGIFLQLVFDGIYGPGTIASPSSPRHNLKTGSQIPVHLIAEIDRKIDDGMPNAGSFQFSRYQGNGTAAPTDGSVTAPSCTSATTPAATWNVVSGSTNCGAASFL